MGFPGISWFSRAFWVFPEFMGISGLSRDFWVFMVFLEISGFSRNFWGFLGFLGFPGILGDLRFFSEKFPNLIKYFLGLFYG